MKRYVVGFMFDSKMESVVMVKKNRPAWQAGLHNGIGGKIEDGETPVDAMVREFSEEAGVESAAGMWAHVLTLRFPYAEVEFFACQNDEIFRTVKTCTDEEVVQMPIGRIEGKCVVENIPAAIELSMQRLVDHEF